MEVADTTLKEVAASAPKLTAVTPLKPLPVTVTEVPPTVEPEDGLSEVTVGGAARPTKVLIVPLFVLAASPRNDSPYVASTLCRIPAVLNGVEY